MPNPQAVSVEDLSVTFERWGQRVAALRNVTLAIAPGQWVLLTGQNGSGKSTLLRAISGQLVPDGGRILLDGSPVAKLSTRGRAASVFLVHQDPVAGTAPNLTALQNLLLADEGRGPRKEQYARYRKLLRTVGLVDREHQPVSTLSEGQRQIVTLLIAQLRPARVLLLDEPFASLDRANTTLAIKLLSELHHAGRTILHVSHDPTILDHLGDRVIVLERGEVIADSVRMQQQEKASL